MKLTTVAILVISSVACCNAQRYTLTEKLHVVTDVREAIGAPRYFKLDSTHVLIKPKTGVTQNEIRRRGVTIRADLGNDLLIVDANQLGNQYTIEFVEQILPVNYLWKLSENVRPEELSSDNEFIVLIKNAAKFSRQIQAAELKATIVKENLVRVQGKLSAVSGLLQDENVLYVGKESFSPKEESSVLDLYLGPNQINKVHHEFPELNGNGVVISIKERHYNVADIDLRGRHVPSSLSAQDTSDHATDMATIVAGAGNSFITGRGVAPHAHITSSSFFNLFPDNSGQLLTLNTWLQNHSYGTAIENFYGTLANAYDQQTFENPKILHVFSSGNSGTSNATSGVYTAVNGFSNLTGNSKMAKNVLVVGSVDTTGNALPFSSRGPTNDGRIKPELVAYSSVGTSNSSALVTGVAALMQQVYKEQHGSYPESALLKAILINSADDVGLPGVDFITGYGNLNAHRSIDNLREGRYFEGTVTHDEIKNFPLNIPPNAKNLKVTLVWTDLAGTVNASKPIMNNLDVRLVTSTGAILPWVLNITANATALTAPATRGIDNINTVEQVTLADAGPEILAVSVRGTDLLSSQQKFYVAYQWDARESFTWSYPTGSDNFPYNGETGTYFFWKSMLSAERGDLEITTDNGNTWKPITKNLLLKKGYYRWQNPTPINVEAKARMNVNGTIFETEHFTISKALIPSLGFNCTDSALMQWSKQQHVAHYDVKKLDSDHTTSLVIQTDTAIVITKSSQIVRYSIEPRLANGKPLLRSPAIDIEKFGAGCFISTFVDESITDEGVLLRLELGTTYGIDKIYFERMEKKSFVTIHSVKAPDRNVQRYLDIDPVQGVNHYRARVLLKNNQEVITDTIQNYFLTKTPFIIFPNPIVADKDINVYAGKFETINFQLELYNANGMLVRSTNLLSDRETVSTIGLPPGFYIYRIRGQAVDVSGKIIIK